MTRCPVQGVMRRNAPHTVQNYALGLLSLVAFLYACRVLRTGIANFKFDDALMFTRYATNLRNGYGISWNPGGPHVFGLTSLPWLLIVWLGSFLPIAPITMLVCASWVFGIASLGVLSSPSRFLRDRDSRVSPLALSGFIALPLVLNEHFAQAMTNGMETMLALFLISCFAFLVQRSLEARSQRSVAGLAALGFFVVLTRPEALITVIALPLSMWLLGEKRRHRQAIVTFLLTTAALLIVSLVVARMYFGLPLPLAMYCKWLRGYAGYRLLLNPAAYSAYFLQMALVPCLTITLCIRRGSLRMVTPFLITLILQIAYLATVTQIMGWGARYYVPYLPLLFCPAILLLNQASGSVNIGSQGLSGKRLAASMCVVCVCNAQIMSAIYGPIGRLRIRNRAIYAEPHFVTATQVPLPEVEWWASCLAVTGIAKALPAGAIVSASEVGALGAFNPGLTVLDSSGLNDAAIATGRAAPDHILQERPDLVWLIHSDYTKDFGEIASDPDLLKKYTLYAHAFNFGIAIRKDSPYYGQLLRQLREAWEKAYPGFDMEDYKTSAVFWVGRPAPDRKRAISVQP